MIISTTKKFFSNFLPLRSLVVNSGHLTGFEPVTHRLRVGSPYHRASSENSSTVGFEPTTSGLATIDSHLSKTTLQPLSYADIIRLFIMKSLSHQCQEAIPDRIFKLNLNIFDKYYKTQSSCYVFL